MAQRHKPTTRVRCSLCGCQWDKRVDSMTMWQGRCRRCAQWVAKGAPTEAEKRRKATKRQRAWVAVNKDRKRGQAVAWQKRHPNKVRYASSTRRAGIRQATPRWADVQAIRKFYESCPQGYRVDHVIPLRGKGVCGLHVIENLQYLTASENYRKSNKYDDGTST